jgi:hypothetical protein
MAVTLTEIREGIAANLAVLDGCQVSAYMMANPTPPAVHLYPAQVDYDLAMGRGLDQWMFTVQAFVGLSTDIGAQMKLDEFMAPSGSQSVKAAVESDGTLGGIVADTTVVSCTGYRVYARESGSPVLGAEWQVDVLASGI